MADNPPDTPPTRSPAPVGPVAVRVANGPLVAPVLSRVVSMVLARADCPVDRLEDALILCDAIAAHAPAHSRDGHVSFRLDARSGAIELRVAGLRPGGGAELIADTRLPDVGNVIERFSDYRRIEPAGSAADPAGRTADPAGSAAEGSGEELVLALRFG